MEARLGANRHKIDQLICQKDLDENSCSIQPTQALQSCHLPW